MKRRRVSSTGETCPRVTASANLCPRRENQRSSSVATRSASTIERTAVMTSALSVQKSARGSHTVLAGMAPNPIRAITIDALGTLLELLPPAPRLRDGLRERFGLEVSDARGGAGDAGGDRLLPRAPAARARRGRARRAAAPLRRGAARHARGAGPRPRRADRGAAGGDPLRALPGRRAGAAGAAGGRAAAGRGVELGRLAARAARAHRPAPAARRRGVLRRGRRGQARPGDPAARAGDRGRRAGRRAGTSATISRPTSAPRGRRGCARC